MGGLGLTAAALIGCGGDDDGAAATATRTGEGEGQATGTASPGASGSEIKRGGIYRQALTGEPPTLDPYRNASVSTKTFAGHAYSRLFMLETDPDLDPYDLSTVPDVAVSSETEDGQHWVVKLKQGVKFQDVQPVGGRELTSEDVLFSWDRLTGADSPNATQVKEIVNVEAIDDYTLNFTTSQPLPEFMELLANASLLWILPTEADGGFNPSMTAIGSGPWILESHDTDVKMTWRANPDYHIAGLPYMDGIEETVVPEYANRKAQYQAGNIFDAAITADDVIELMDGDPDTQWARGTGAGVSWIAFSGEEVDPDAIWRDERFRQALSMSLDRNVLNEYAGNVTAIKQAGLVPFELWNNVQPASFGKRYWLDPQSPEHGPSGAFFQHNPEEAKRLWDAVGVDSTPIKYQYTERYGATFLGLAEAQAGMITEAGLPLRLEQQDYNSIYITQTFLGQFTGIVYGLETLLPPGGYVERLFGDDPANHGKVHDPVIDDLAAKQAVELDEAQRTEYLYDIQRRNGEMMFYVPTQSSATAGWTAYKSFVRNHRRTRGYGGATENTGVTWLDQ
ncbi:MAG: ABC transporter substrate-binding protein [Dehalococcoidia bacterium]|nr:ABC transporter substrate-binding protein [Dehalococcoidia bacterium]